jgi:polyisoprenyl-phosphate glycosyltransferase
LSGGSIQYSVVVPVYMGVRTLPSLVDRLVDMFRALDATYEIVLVDDGSTDGSWDVILALVAARPTVAGVRLTRNFGQHNATLEGIRHSSGAFVVTLDEDLQHPPEEIPKLIAEQRRTDADVVYGIPEERKDPGWRRIASRLAKWVPRRVMGVDFDLSSFRLIAGPVARAVVPRTRHDVILDIHLSWATSRFASTPVRHAAAERGHSGYSAWRLARIFVDVLCGYTVLPLRISIVCGFLLSIVALAAGFHAIYWKVIGGIDIPGYTSLIVALTFSSGLLLIAIGIASEYLARIFLQAAGKPAALVREVVGGPAPRSELVSQETRRADRP